MPLNGLVHGGAQVRGGGADEGVAGGGGHAQVYRAAEGSFDCVGASLRGAATLLRMTT